MLETGRLPPDPLEDFKGLSIQAPDGRGARTKKPSRYVQCVLAGEGMATSCATAGELPKGVPRASVVKVCEDDGDTTHFALAAIISAGVEPKNEAEVHGSPDWPKWHDAMRQEVRELKAKSTWQLVNPLTNANIVGSRWTYRLKRDVNGTIVRYKARLVAQGFTQAPGVDYQETFALVAKLTSNRIVLPWQHGTIGKSTRWTSRMCI